MQHYIGCSVLYSCCQLVKIHLIFIINIIFDYKLYNYQSILHNNYISYDHLVPFGIISEILRPFGTGLVLLGTVSVVKGYGSWSKTNVVRSPSSPGPYLPLGLRPSPPPYTTVIKLYCQHIKVLSHTFIYKQLM